MMGAVLRKVAADLLSGLDDGLSEVLWMLGVNRTSRSQRRAAAELLAEG